MKKFLFAVLLCVLSVSAFADGLSPEEVSTTKKLKEKQIYTMDRSIDQWNQPIKTIDSASADLKMLSLWDRKAQLFDHRIRQTHRTVISQGKQIRENRQEQGNVNFLLFIVALFGVLK